MEQLYKQYFDKIDMNNTLVGISLLQESDKKSKINIDAGEEYFKIDMPEKGLVNTKVLPVQHKVIGFDLNNTEIELVPENESEKIKIKEREEINKRLYESYPRNRNLKPHEEEDLKIKKRNEELKKIEYENNLAKHSKGFSFLQKQNNEDYDNIKDYNLESKNEAFNHLNKKIKFILSKNKGNMSKIKIFS
jgi:hypothetical protein